MAAMLSVVAVIAILGGAANAAPQMGLNSGETLQDLINLNATGGVQIGKLIFSDFSYSGNGSPNPAPSATSIQVNNSPYSSPSSTGLEFVASWQGFTGDDQDSLISYAVQAAPGFVLTGVRLDFNGAALVVSSGTKASVIETVNTLLVDGSGNPTGPGSPIGQLTVFNTQAGGNVGTNTVLESISSLSPVEAGIFVQKDIQLNGGTNGVSSISFVANTYNFVAGAIPEPTSGCLLGFMSTGLLTRRRRS
jgi:hypothetical protein